MNFQHDRAALISFRFKAIALALALFYAVSAVRAASIELQNGAFRVTGWNAPSSPPASGWAPIFAVYTGPADAPPLLGTYALENGALVFRPKYPFAAGVRYRAVFHPPGGAAILKVFDGPPLPVNPQAGVENVYPSGDILPANLSGFTFASPRR